MAFGIVNVPGKLDAEDIKAVPETRTINGKPLSADVALKASDVGAAASDHTHSGYATSGHTHTAADVGALPSGGTATAATKLATERNIQTDLGSTTSVPFNGTANATPGVTGILSIEHGGTGAGTAKEGLANLIKGGTKTYGFLLEDSDCIPLVSEKNGGCKVEMSSLKTYLGIRDVTSSLPTTAGNKMSNNWGGYTWIIVHVTDDLIYMMPTNCYIKTTFGATSEYADSKLIQLCEQFLASLGREYANALCDITVNGVTSRVFVPTMGMLCNNSPAPYNGYPNGRRNYEAKVTSSVFNYGDGTDAYTCFDAFNTNYDAMTSSRHPFSQTSGESFPSFWTSTPSCEGYVWSIDSYGKMYQGGRVSSEHYFWPCVAVMRH